MTKKKIYLDSLLMLLVMAAIILGLEYAGNLMAKPNDYVAYTVAEKDITDIHVNADGSNVETIELQTLIRNQLSVDKESQADIPYLAQFQTVEVLEAHTITAQGKRIPVAKNAIRMVDDDNSEGKAMFSDMKHKIIVFPNVGVGARTYYKVVTKTHTPLFPGHYFSRWWFGAGTEWAHSEINLSHDPAIEIQVDSKDVKGGRVEDGPNGEVRYRLSYQKEGVAVSEPNQISDSDVFPYVHISSFKDHLDMAKAYEARAADKSRVTPEVQKLANQITKGIVDPKDQARAVYNWVSKEIRYVAIYLGAGGVVPHYADEIIKNRYGDCKDKTTLLIALLNAKGIAASSADINSGNSYSLPRLAVLGPFNHVITYLPQWDIYLDPTAERAPFGVLPYNELDKPTVLTGLGKLGRTPKPNAKLNIIKTSVALKVQRDGQIKGTSHTNYFGSEDIKARYKYEGTDSAYGERAAREQLAAARLAGTGTYKPSLASDLDKPFELETTFALDPIANVPGPAAISIPMGLAPREFEHIVFSKSIEKPTKPVVCRSRTIEDVQTIEFPSNVKLGLIPSGIEYKEGGINYISSYIKKENQVEIKRKVVIQHPSMVCGPNEIRAWNKFVSVLQKDLRSQVFYE
jgi:transglutaminase-like putative cysteine protease